MITAEHQRHPALEAETSGLIAMDMEVYFAQMALDGLIGLIRTLTARQLPVDVQGDVLNGQPLKDALYVGRCPHLPLAPDLPSEGGGSA